MARGDDLGNNAITCRMTTSKWRPGQVVPTYFVSPRPRKGCFSQISDAIQHAQPFSRIELLSGVYTESVVINKAIELGSEKGDEQAIITYHLTAMIIQSSEAHIEGVTIRNSESQAAVRIDRGSPRLLRCDVAGVEVCNDATPLVEECKIENSAVHGISVLQIAGGMYKGNSILGSGWYGINVESTGPVTFMHNTITESAQGQIIVRGSQDVNPVFQYNRVIDQIKTQLDPNLLHQTMAYKLEHLPVKTAGMNVVLMPVEMTTSIKSSLSDDAVDDAVVASFDLRCAIDVCQQSHPSFVRNTIVGSMNNGFYVHGGAHGMFEHNYISSNRGWAFVLDGESTKAHVIANSINGNGGGIKVVAAPSVIDGKNELVENRGPQLMIVNGHENFVFRNNEVRSGTKIGALMREGGSGLVEANNFDQCGTAIRVEHGANPLVKQNVFTMSNIGVYALRGGCGNFVENEFGNLTAICALLSTAANPTFTNCRFLTSQGGVLCTKGARGVFRHCIFKDNKGVQLEIVDRANPKVIDCFIADGRDDGVKVHNRGLGTLRHNMIAGNERSQICIRTRADPIIEENVITRSHHDGILVEDGGMGTIVNNIIERCRLSGISAGSNAQPTVRGNIITFCRDAGIYIAEGGNGGSFEKNDIFKNGRVNIHISGSGIAPSATDLAASTAAGAGSNQRLAARAPSLIAASLAPPAPAPPPSAAVAMIRSNKIFAALGHGIHMSSRSEALIVDNLFESNETGAIRVAHGSDATILRNEFIGGKDGIAVCEDSKARVVANTFCELQGYMLSADEGSKVCVFCNTVEHCKVGLVLKNCSGFVFLNAIFHATQEAMCLGGLCRATIRHNALFENIVGVRLEARCRGILSNNVIFESETAGLVIGGDESQTLIEGNVIINAKQHGILVGVATDKKDQTTPSSTTTSAVVVLPAVGAPAASGIGGGPPAMSKCIASLNLIMNCLQGVSFAFSSNVGPSAVAFLNCYISCCQRGVQYGPKTGGRVESSLIAHCEVGAEMVNSTSSAMIKGCVIHNTSAVGFRAVHKASGDVVDSVFFKNFINAVCEGLGTEVTISSSLLQAPVVFSVVCTSHAVPTVTRCVVASRALNGSASAASAADGGSSDRYENEDLTKDNDRIAKSIRSNLVKRFGESKVRDEFPAAHTFRIRSLWEDLYATNAARVGGLPPEWEAEVEAERQEHIRAEKSLQRAARRAEQQTATAAGEASRRASDAVSDETSRPPSAASSVNSYASSVNSKYTSATNGGADSSHDPADNDDEETADGELITFRAGTIVTTADLLLSRLQPIPRRTAILFPSNFNDCPTDYIGPGGPLALMRTFGGESMSYLRGMFTYYATGIYVNEGAKPSIDNCVIRDHLLKPMRIASKRIPPVPADPMAMKPLSNAKQLLLASDAAKKLRSSVTAAKSGGKQPQPPAAGSRKISGRRHSSNNNAKRSRGVAIQGGGKDGDEGDDASGGGLDGAAAGTAIAAASANTGAGSTTTSASHQLPDVIQLPGCPFPLQRRNVVDCLLLVGSPTFYQHPSAPHPFVVLPTLFAPQPTEDDDAAAIGASPTGAATGGTFSTSAAPQQSDGGANGSSSADPETPSPFAHMRRKSRQFLPHETEAESRKGDDVGETKPTSEVLGNNAARLLLQLMSRNQSVTAGGSEELQFLTTAAADSFIGYGIVFEGRGTGGQVSRCQFFRNQTAIRVESHADPQVSICIVSQQHDVGVWVRHQGRGAFKANRLSKNRVAQVFIEDAESQPTFDDNEVTESASPAFCFCRHAGGEVMSNRITKIVGTAAIVVESSASPRIQGNRLEDCQFGLWFRFGGGGTAESNVILNSTKCGVFVEGDGACPLLRCNNISLSKDHGLVVVGDGAKPTCIENKFLQNSPCGVVVRSGSGGEFSCNTISKNSENGLWITGVGSNGLYEGNIITENGMHGILMESDASPFIQYNLIRANGLFGVASCDAQGTVATNGIMGHVNSGGGGLKCFGPSTTTMFEQNDVDHNLVGVLIEGSARPELLFNAITRNEAGGILVQGRLCDPTIRQCVIKHNSKFGVRFCFNAVGNMSECVVVFTVDGSGIVLDNGCNPTIQSTISAYHAEHGVLAGANAAGSLVECVFTKCGRDACRMQDCSNLLRLKQCIFVECEGGSGVFAEKNAGGSVIGCCFIGNRFRQAAAVVQESSSLVFDSSLFVDQRIGLWNCGGAKVLDCLFQSCGIGMLETSSVGDAASRNGNSQSSCQCTSTEFRECTFAGFQCARGAPKLVGCTFTSCSRFGYLQAGLSAGTSSILSGAGATGEAADTAPAADGDTSASNQSNSTANVQSELDKCTFQRCRFGVQLDGGGGLMQNCDVVNCQTGIVFASGETELRSNTIYDCSGVGLHVKDGKPMIIANLIYDCYDGGAVLDKGSGGSMDDNKFYFARDEGALVIRPTALSIQNNRNTTKNAFSPPKEKSYADRQLVYKRQEMEKEKSSAIFRKFARVLDVTFASAFQHLPVTTERVTLGCEWPEWILSEEPSVDRPEASGANSSTGAKRNGALGSPTARQSPKSGTASSGVVANPWWTMRQQADSSPPVIMNVRKPPAAQASPATALQQPNVTFETALMNGSSISGGGGGSSGGESPVIVLDHGQPQLMQRLRDRVTVAMDTARPSRPSMADVSVSQASATSPTTSLAPSKPKSRNSVANSSRRQSRRPTAV